MVGGGGERAGARSGRLVPHEDHVLDLPGLQQPEPAGLVAAGPEEAGRVGGAHEERGEDQLEFVGEALGEQLGVDQAAALDHEAPYAPDVVQVREESAPVELGAERDDVGGEAEGTGASGALVGGVEDLLAAGVPEPGRRVEVAGAADGDLERVLRFTGGRAGGAPLVRVDQQPRVVGADGPGAHQDRVHGRPDLVDPVEVRWAGQEQAFGAGVVQVAVEGDGGGQQDVRVGHRRSRLVGTAD